MPMRRRTATHYSSSNLVEESKMATIPISTGTIESEALVKEHRLAQDRLDRFVESVRQMDAYIKTHRARGLQSSEWWPVRLVRGLVVGRSRDVGNQASSRIRRG